MIDIYRERRVTVEAVQFDGTNNQEVCSWAPATDFVDYLTLDTEYGTVNVLPSDWVLKRSNGQFDTMTNESFTVGYEAQP